MEKEVPEYVTSHGTYFIHLATTYSILKLFHCILYQVLRPAAGSKKTILPPQSFHHLHTFYL